MNVESLSAINGMRKFIDEFPYYYEMVFVLDYSDFAFELFVPKEERIDIRCTTHQVSA